MTSSQYLKALTHLVYLCLILMVGFLLACSGSMNKVNDSVESSYQILEATSLSVSELDSQIKLSWAKVSESDMYYLYWDTKPINEDSKIISVGRDVTTYLHKQLTNNITYYYKIVAVYADGNRKLNGLASREVIGTPKLNEIENNEIGEMSDVVLEPIEVVSPEPKKAVVLEPIKVVSPVPKKVVVSKPPNLYRELPAPILQASASDSRIKLTWTQAKKAKQYYIYWNTKGSDYVTWKNAIRIDNGSTTTYIHDGLGNGKRHYYQISAVYGKGDQTVIGKMSDVVSEIPISYRELPAPILQASASDSRIKLTWTQAKKAKQYYIYWNTKGSDYVTWKNAIRIDNGSTTTYTHDGLDNVKRHYYQISAVYGDEDQTVIGKMSDVASGIPNSYEEFFVGLTIDSQKKQKIIINAERYREMALNRMSHMKNPLWSIKQTGEWVIYYHIENWNGPVTALAITNLTNEYERIANQWLGSLEGYDSEAPKQVDVKVFGFVFNTGVDIDSSFYDTYGNYPVVTNFPLKNEQTPWVIQYRSNAATFNQNWYKIIDYLQLKVVGNRSDLNNVHFSPQDWSSYTHPEGVDMFYTKFWHKTKWDAVAQRQYLKIGGQIQNYQNGSTNYRVFAHEMGHTFFLDDVYDRGKFPNANNLPSIMNRSNHISDFDKVTLRMVWKLQK